MLILSKDTKEFISMGNIRFLPFFAFLSLILGIAMMVLAMKAHDNILPLTASIAALIASLLTIVAYFIIKQSVKNR